MLKHAARRRARWRSRMRGHQYQNSLPRSQHEYHGIIMKSAKKRIMDGGINNMEKVEVSYRGAG